MLEKWLVLLGNRCWPSMGCNGTIELNFDSSQGKKVQEAYLKMPTNAVMQTINHFSFFLVKQCRWVIQAGGALSRRT